MNKITKGSSMYRDYFAVDAENESSTSRRSEEE